MGRVFNMCIIFCFVLSILVFFQNYAFAPEVASLGNLPDQDKCERALELLKKTIDPAKAVVSKSYRDYLTIYLRDSTKDNKGLSREGRRIIRDASDGFRYYGSYSNFERAVKKATSRCRQYFKDYRNKKPKIYWRK